MEFKEKKAARKTGKIAGYVAMFFIFATVLYFILKLLDKIPDSWGYFHIVGITVAISLVGGILKKVLK